MFEIFSLMSTFLQCDRHIVLRQKFETILHQQHKELIVCRVTFIKIKFTTAALTKAQAKIIGKFQLMQMGHSIEDMLSNCHF